jgi:hypothetical protein
MRRGCTSSTRTRNVVITLGEDGMLLSPDGRKS